MSDFYRADEPVEISSFGWEECGVVDRVYFIVKLQSSDTFLRNTKRPSYKKSWTKKVTAATFFTNMAAAIVYCKTKFSNVRIATKSEQ